MFTLNNHKPITGIVEIIPNIKDRVEETTRQMNCYLECLKDERFEEIPNEREDNAIKRAEKILDKLNETAQRNQVVKKSGNEALELIDEIKTKMESVIKGCENDEINIEKSNNELIDKIIEMEERIMRKDIEPFQKSIDERKQIFNNKKKGWNGRRLNYGEYQRKKNEDEEFKQKINQRIGFEEISQIEEWTQKKIGSVIFDSDFENWNRFTSVFDQKIMNKSNLLFLVHGENNNLFGGYINAKIDRVNSLIHDPNSFVFSLKSNGRFNKSQKFDNNNPQYAFYLWDKTNEYLFDIGNYGDIRIGKENKKYESFCNQHSFNYNGIERTLCEKAYPDKFTPTRITVWNCQFVEDENAFLFVIDSNGRLDDGMRFMIKMGCCENSFYLDTEDSNILFMVGCYGNDLKVMKEGIDGSSCLQTSFQYNGILNAICGSKQFIPTRIIAIQLAIAN